MLQSENNYDDASRPQPQFLDRSQKLAVFFLFIFVLAIVSIGFYQFRSNLAGAIDYTRGESRRILDADELASTSQAIFKGLDTDLDGLSDWDERNVYDTSAYLDDTDGDSIKDGDEVRNRTNPNCFEGKTCQAGSFLTDVAATSTAAATNGGAKPVFSAEQLQQLQQVNQLLKEREVGGVANGETDSAGTASDEATKQLLGGQASAQNLRAALLGAGMKQADLDKISDDILMKNYSEILRK